jgi:hypothetical protein
VLCHSLVLVLGLAAAGCSTDSDPTVAAGAAYATGGEAGGGAGVAGTANGTSVDGDGGASAGAAETSGAIVLGTGGEASGTGGESTGGDDEADASISGNTGRDAGSGDDTAARLVLFDGTGLDEWRPSGGNGQAPWQVLGDGTMVVAPGSGNIATRRTFEDLFVHVEYKTPPFPANVTGQARGNSGVYLNNRYELQILDSFGLPPAVDGCGAIYLLRAPASTACYAQEVWNTYEIEFRAARWDANGNKTANARVLSTFLNGVLVHENVDIPNSTGLGEREVPGARPLVLQDHGDRVSFRNIWVIPR